MFDTKTPGNTETQRGRWSPFAKIPNGSTFGTDPTSCPFNKGISDGCHRKKRNWLVNKHNYGKSQFLMGKLTINGHFQ